MKQINFVVVHDLLLTDLLEAKKQTNTYSSCLNGVTEDQEKLLDFEKEASLWTIILCFTDVDTDIKNISN